MRIFIPLCFALSSLFIFTSISGQVNKIEHFFASSPNAKKLFDFFSKELELPVLWNYQTWRDFSSGGVTLGNVAFEFVNYKGVDSTSFNGIALEPQQHMEEFEKELDKLGIPHDTIDNSNVLRDSTGALRGWSLLTPKEVLPSEANLFVCDYKNRQGVADNRKKGADNLKEIHGSGLGVILLKEIVIGAADVKKHANQLQKFSDIKKNKDNLFSFKEGPALRLQRSEKSGIQKIVIKVESLESAKKFLVSKKILGEVNRNSIFISPAAIDGLQVELLEK